MLSSEAAAFAGPAASGTPQKAAIYGSVSTADICNNMRAILAEDREGARVVLAPEDISFAEAVEGAEKDRVKKLGVFEIVVRPKGGADEVRRTIKINAQD